jgi:hypothetical protein
MTTKISEANIQEVTLGALGGGGPKISSIIVTDSSYNNLDDTAVALEGGYIKLIGEDFAAGCQVLIGLTPATSVTFVSDTEVRAQVPATAAGTYIVYLVNSDGGTAIRVNAITFSSTPTWVTGSSLISAVNSAISIQLSASLAATYSLQAGSSLPSGVSLSSSGLISGTVTGVSSETVYNFTVLATDTELQDSPRSFALTITVGDPYFMFNTLLLPGNGTNNANNNTFLDSSTNNFTVTRNGNTTQGTFSPYGANWSNYFDGNGDYLSIPDSSQFSLGSSNFTMEAWIYPTATGNFPVIAAQYQLSSLAFFWSLGPTATPRDVNFYVYYSGGNTLLAASNVIVLNTWSHHAVVRNSNTLTYYINGVSVATVAFSTTVNDSAAFFTIGNGGDTNYTTYPFTGYISNYRLVIGTAVYTSNFTPSITPLTAIANTRLLTCADNRFIDDSTNNFTVTRSGDVSVQRFSPFSPVSSYSTSTVGGSAYFDGTDYWTAEANTAFNFGTGDFTIECWVYPIANGLNFPTFLGSVTGWSAGASGHRFNNIGYANKFWFGLNGSGGIASGDPFMASASTFSANTWHHYALTRSGNTWRMFVNGVLENTQTFSGSYDAGFGGLRSGWSTWDVGQGYFTGYTSNLRLVKGTAVYTSAFTPPTAPVTSISGTSLLCNFTNAGIIDNTMMNNIETVGDAKISTTQSKFGGSSMYFDGTGDCLLAPSSPNFDFGTSNFTIEMWINFANVNSTWQAVISRAYTIAGGWRLYKYDGNNQLSWYAGPTNPIITTGSTLASNTWGHVAVVRNSGTLTIYINGVNRGSAADSTNYNPGNYAVEIGKGVVTSEYPVTGYIDDLRITKGYARYTSNFTPPVSALLTQ